jgi:hypothetical protein
MQVARADILNPEPAQKCANDTAARHERLMRLSVEHDSLVGVG